METFCRETGGKYRHFFYGGVPEVPEQLAEILEQRHKVKAVGTYSPPFRPLTADEDADVVRLMNQAEPDVLWVGLSTPKQDYWMYEHRDRFQVPVLIGVGAAFVKARDARR